MASDIAITFLGTSSAQPTLTRNMSSLCVGIDGDYWMVDCGEGTQHQIGKSIVKASKIAKIFITHTHGDHMFGLPGLLCTISGGVTSEGKIIEIFGPRGIRQFIRTSLNTSYSLLNYSVKIYELLFPNETPSCEEEGKLHFEIIGGNLYQNEKQLWDLPASEPMSWMSAGPLCHAVPCIGYVFQEKTIPGSLNAAAVTPLLMKHKQAFIAQGIKNPMSLMGDLKAGKAVNLPDGSVINPADILGPPKVGRKLVILGDTSDSSGLLEIAQDCSVVVHEATNAKVGDEEKSEEEVEKSAISHGHSTPQLAGTFAKNANAKLLVLNHFSSRFKGDQSPESVAIMDEIATLAKTTYGSDNVVAAYDFLTVPIPKK